MARAPLAARGDREDGDHEEAEHGHGRRQGQGIAQEGNRQGNAEEEGRSRRARQRATDLVSLDPEHRRENTTSWSVVCDLAPIGGHTLRLFGPLNRRGRRKFPSSIGFGPAREASREIVRLQATL